MESYSLSELNQFIKQQLKHAMPGFYWVVAEINEIHVNGTGHCFMELVEKAPQSEQITAKTRANIWAYHHRMLAPYFETMTGQRLAAGLKVMLQVSIEFHELYGISLQVTDINPAFTVGDLAIQRQAVIWQLTDEGVIDMNRELELTIVPQSIAVISSESAAGYGDFADQLHHNPYGYAFTHVLFPAVMQGNEAEASIIRALDLIFEREEEFDAVVLIRGGGSQSDLNCFNSYRLACSLAQFPLPVITGIGHDRDETIADLVACIPLKTPTAVAEYLINRAIVLDRSLQELTQALADAAAYTLRQPSEKLRHLSQRFQTMVRTYVHLQEKDLQAYRFRLAHAAHSLLAKKSYEHSHFQALLHSHARNPLQREHVRLPDLQKRLGKQVKVIFAGEQKQIVWLDGKIRLLDPVNLLHRGYSITFADGKVVRSIHTLREGQLIETQLPDGKTESVITKKRP